MVRKSSSRHMRSAALWAALIALFVNLGSGAAFAGSAPVLAQSEPVRSGTISGAVVTTDATPVSGASVVLEGVSRQTTSTDARGTFRFDAVAPGVYALTIVKAGFTSARQENVVVTAGSTATLSIPLTASGFSSLRQIGRVSTSAPGRAQINTSPGALAVLSNQTFVDQGQQQVTKILNETPGIVASRTSVANSASQASPVIPQIRGALPYETETLVDGHPVSVGANGYFSPLYLNPALLQDVEIAKGPGVFGTDINYAIGGSVNYRTLEPTRTFQAAVDLGLDNYAGTSPSVRITGSTPTHVVDYAFAYALNGTPGPLRDYRVAGSQVPLVYGGAALNADGTAPWFVNGRGYAGFPEGIGPSKTPQYAGLPGQAYFAQPFYVCCSTVNTQYLARAELAKLRFNISQQTALTLSYLGAQSTSDQTGAQANSVSPLLSGGDFSTFTPPQGYTGTVAAGTAIPFDLAAYLPLYNSIQQSLFQSELRSAIGKTTVLARYYAGTNNQFTYSYSKPTNESFAGNAWGGVALCSVGVAFNFATKACADGSAPTPTFFNGQPTSFTSGPAQQTTLTQDHLRGYSLELDEPVGDNFFTTLAFDRSHHDSLNDVYSPVQGVIGYQLAPGSGQQFTTILARAQLALTRRLTATIGNYAIQYASHYSGDGGATFSDSTRSFDAPRLAFSWRPNVDVAWRLAAGSSIAPPYINLVSAPAQVPQPDSVPASYFNLNTNSGAIKPETAFGYDLGFDKRIARSMSLSTDLYLTNLHDMFLPSTFQQGTFASAASNGVALPLYIRQTRNLAFARYEGIEVALQNAPLAGWGFKLQGTLQRGYPYDLPAGFYDTAAGPYTTNLAVISGANFQPSGLGYNGVGASGLVGRVPYSTGYGELNFRAPHGFYGNLGLTYFGSNNGYNRPAFGVVSAALRVPLAPEVSLQVTGDNLTGAYDKAYFGYFDGVPVPLVNGAHGAKAGYVGTTDGGTYGPTTLRASIRYEFGKRQ